MHLPTEIHDQILQHVARADLPAYRLICRGFEDRGAIRLFQRIRFKMSLFELKRLANISSDNFLGSCVQKLVWDTKECEYEARSLMEGLRMRELKYLVDGLALHREPRSPHEGRNSADDTEGGQHSSLGVFLLHAIFSGFPNLQRIFVLTDGFPKDEWNRPELVHGPADEDWYCAHNGDRRVQWAVKMIQSNGSYEMETAVRAAQLAGCRVQEIRARYLSRVDFCSGIGNAIAHLTILHLVLGFGSELSASASRVSLKFFLRSAINLQVLALGCTELVWWPTRFNGASLRLQDIITSPKQFLFLREFSIGRCATSEEFLSEFLSAHSGTLKALRMENLRLEPNGSWIGLLRSLGVWMSFEHVWLNGCFYGEVTRLAEWWGLHGLNGSALEEFLRQC